MAALHTVATRLLLAACLVAGVAGCGGPPVEAPSPAPPPAPAPATPKPGGDALLFELVGPDNIYGAGKNPRDTSVALARSICDDYLGVGISVADVVGIIEPGNAQGEMDLRNFVVAAHAAYCPEEDLDFA